MARRTFFSFHYKPDVHRAWNVRNSWVTSVYQTGREDAGFFDSSVFEASQRVDDDTLKRFLRDGLKNTSVTCVLVGAETALRRWVRYEIFRSFMCGNGLLAIRIHSIADLEKRTSTAGSDPFECMAFQIDKDRVWFSELMKSGWQRARDVPSMPLSDLRYEVGQMRNNTLNCLFPIYDWNADRGRENIGDWIENAANSAGR